ncbi:MAG: hypothetical protein G01um101433_68 [Parcubacteria group bacterium Gr01-1014_33]|nr:MAG: hypothetical protein G01um101433_68 [Parcubacteria group bacterium Gr01-1014_33]
MNKIGRIEGLSPPPGDNSEELVRKLSRTVLHTAERGRRSLFERMTAANAQKIAELLKKKPLFYKNEKDAPREILLIR